VVTRKSGGLGVGNNVGMKSELLSLVSPPVAVALIAVLGTYFTARAALADVVLKRRLETAKRFTELAEVASNVGAGKGLYEQIAAIELLASFGRDEPHLREAARAVLKEIQAVGAVQALTPGTKLVAAAALAEARLPKPKKK
jgi:hypothetical protein